jgi:hypothetical protein
MPTRAAMSRFERKNQIASASGMRDDGDGGSIDER